ncbi:MAG: hypothetical protein WA136_02220 [Rhodoferax sp.]
MVEVNIHLFERLRGRLPSEFQQSVGTVQRFVSTDASEKDWLKNVAFSTDPDLVFSAQQRVCIATYRGESFLVCVGFKPDFSSEEFIYQEVNAGLFCAAVVELELEPLIGEATGYELVDTIFYPVDFGQAQRIAYDWATVARFFPTFYLYRIPPGSPFLAIEQLVTRVGLFSITKTFSLLPMSWSAEALEVIREICTNENEHFPLNLVLHAMLERKWEHAFLDVYRCIEFLFPFPKVNDLRRALGLDTSTIDVSYQIESVLGWRQQEDVALNSLFVKLPDEQLNLLSVALGMKVDEIEATESLGKTVSKRIYKLRNDCVHYRPAQSKSQLKDEVNWTLLVPELLKAASVFHRNETSPQV